jgi:hypothetical protein
MSGLPVISRCVQSLAVGAILVAIAVAAQAESSPAPSSPPGQALTGVDEWLFTGDALEGTFLQLNIVHRGWTDERWRAELANLRRIGMRSLILQWAEYDDVSFVTDGGGAGPSTIERILAIAGELGLECHIGLSLRSSWYQVEQVTPAYLEQELTRNIRTAEQLQAKLRGAPGFAGWYVPHEVSVSLYTEPQRELILGFMEALTRRLKQLDALKPILASGYTDPTAIHLARFTLRWEELLYRSGVDVWLFQDGAGTAREGDWRKILPYLEAMTIVEEESTSEVWFVAELFTQTAGPPLNQGPFRAVPAEISRVREQMAALGALKRKLIAFSYFDYMRPSAGAEAAKLFDAYRMLLQEKIAATTGARP